MPVNWNDLRAERVERMHPSDIREILKYGAQADLISLAGGLPAPEVFPVDEYRRAFEWVLETNGRAALQYATTEGYAPLREWIASRMQAKGVACAAHDVLITNGSQQALDLVARVLINPGDRIVVENPSYLGALQAFSQYEPAYSVVPMDEDGMRMDALEQILADDRAGRTPQRIKFIYAVPTFQNPTGRTLTLERRRQLAALADRFGVPVVEDDPYGELRYAGEPLPLVKSFDTCGNVVYLGTFSKILAPGFRLGWVMGSPALLEVLTSAKQPSDLHTGIGPQMATHKVVEDGFVDRHVETVKALYRERRDVMLQAIEEHFPSEARYTRPRGGMFVWAELPERMNTRELLLEAVQEKVAFVPGQGFHADGSGTNTMRLNFSMVAPDKIREGVRRLGRAIQGYLDEHDEVSTSPISI